MCLGQVNKPGALEIKQLEQFTILQAVAQADGFSERATKTKVKVVRQTRTKRKKAIKVNV